jgi:hypothetical protein
MSHLQNDNRFKWIQHGRTIGKDIGDSGLGLSAPDSFS